MDLSQATEGSQSHYREEPGIYPGYQARPAVPIGSHGSLCTDLSYEQEEDEGYEEDEPEDIEDGLPGSLSR